MGSGCGSAFRFSERWLYHLVNDALAPRERAHRSVGLRRLLMLNDEALREMWENDPDSPEVPQGVIAGMDWRPEQQ